MRETTTVCPRDCYDTCGLIATLDERGQLVSVKGDPHHPVTRGITCPRAARDHVRLQANRVEAPALRQANWLVQEHWDLALNAVARRLRQTLDQHGPQAVLLLDYAGNTGLLTQAYPQRLWNAIGATRTDHALCSESGSTALALHYGERHGLAPEELLDSDWIVFWGFNAAVSSPHMWALAREARRSRGARIAVVDPRNSETAQGADQWIQPRPGTDVALAYGVINHLIGRAHVDLDFVGKWTAGYDLLKAAAALWPPGRAAQVTGVAEENIVLLAEAYATLRPGATMIGIGLQKSDHGADQVRAASFIPTVLGQHRGFYYSNGDAFYIDQALLTGQSLASTSPLVVPQVALPDLIQSGQFRFIYIHLMNPALTLPNQRAFRAGLTRPDVFVVVHETHWTETTDYADVILPALTYLEKQDVVIPWSHGYIQYSPAVVPPLAEGRSEVWVMQEIARRLGLAQAWLYRDPWEAVTWALRDAFEENDQQPQQPGARRKLKRKPRDRYPTPSGKIEFHSARAVELGWDPLPVQAALQAGADRFTWLTSATPKYTHTQFQEVYGLIPATVHIHPHDAARLGIEDGDVVLLANELGEVKVNAVVTDAVPAGVLWSPRQSIGLDETPQNALMSSEPQRIGGGPRFNSAKVTVSKLSPAL
jgi:anaerobic selenocysteine-containing dehydrogenase